MSAQRQPCRKCLLSDEADQAAYATVKDYIDSLPPERRTDEKTYRALLPAVIFAVYWFGFGVLLTVLLSVASAILSEFLMEKALRRPVTIDDGSAAVTGLLLALTLPAGTPWYVPVLGSVFAICIAKQVFGGLGDNFVNPALAGRAFLLASFPAAMTTYPLVVDAVTSATPLSSEFAGSVDYLQAFIGRIGGCIGEVSTLALLIGAAYLLIRRVIDWRIPLSYLGTMALLTVIGGGNVLDSVLLGGTVLGAFFMATDYVTSPVTSWGRVIYGVGIGIINYTIRRWGAYPEGTTYAILLMNIAAPLIERFTRPRKYGEVKRHA